MIVDRLASANAYFTLHPQIAVPFDFLKSLAWTNWPDGRHSIMGDDVYVMIETTVGKGRAGVRLESHREYLDVQTAISGEEWFGWRSTSTCRVAEDFKPGGDIAFYDDPPEAFMPLAVGNFAIFLPGDAHAPLAGTGPVKKCVVKVRL